MTIRNPKRTEYPQLTRRDAEILRALETPASVRVMSARLAWVIDSHGRSAAFTYVARLRKAGFIAPHLRAVPDVRKSAVYKRTRLGVAALRAHEAALDAYQAATRRIRAG